MVVELYGFQQPPDQSATALITRQGLTYVYIGTWFFTMITTASMAEMASMQVSDVPRHGKYLEANVVAGRQLQVVNIIGNYLAGYVFCSAFHSLPAGFPSLRHLASRMS